MHGNPGKSMHFTSILSNESSGEVVLKKTLRSAERGVADQNSLDE